MTTTLLNDSFTGTGGTELSVYSSSWVKHPVNNGNISIQNNRGRGGGTGPILYRNNTPPVSADYSVEADLYYAGIHSGALSILARMDDTVATFYMLRVAINSSPIKLELYKFVGGVATLLAGDVIVGGSVGTTYTTKLDVKGSTIKAYLNGSLIYNVADTSITAAGFAGLRDYAGGVTTTGLHVDNFRVDYAVAAALAGDATDNVDVAGDLFTGIKLAGNAGDSAAAAASLTAKIKLQGAASNSANATANLSGGINLAGSALNAANANADLSSSIQLNANSVDVVAASGDLSTGATSNIISFRLDAHAVKLTTIKSSVSVAVNLRSSAEKLTHFKSEVRRAA